MTQGQVMDFLRKYRRKWFNSTELAEALKVSRPSINKCLLRMRRYDEVNEKTVRILFRGKLGSSISKEVLFYSYKRF